MNRKMGEGLLERLPLHFLGELSRQSQYLHMKSCLLSRVHHTKNIKHIFYKYICGNQQMSCSVQGRINSTWYTRSIGSAESFCKIKFPGVYFKVKKAEHSDHS